MRRPARKHKTRQLEQVFEALQSDPTHPFAQDIVCERCGRARGGFLRRARRMDLTPLAKDGYVVTTVSVTVYEMCQVLGATSDLQASTPGSTKALAGAPVHGHGGDMSMTHR